MSLDFTQQHVESLISNSIPQIIEKTTDIQTKLVVKQVEHEAWTRKWGLIVRGIPGEAGENATLTRAKVLKFAAEKLGVQTPLNFVAGCHRLNYG